jgi:hypothetical protein
VRYALRVKKLSWLACIALPAAAAADPPGVTPPAGTATAPTDHVLGVGYKLGDGIGFFGADVIVQPVPHIALDLYGTYVTLSASSGQTGTGYAIAPAVQYHMRDGGVSTPYAAVGMQYVHLTLGDATGSGTGVFANLGYEWKWRSGLGLQLGGGVQYITKVEAMSGTTSISLGGMVAPNLEFGVRYMFL